MKLEAPASLPFLEGGGEMGALMRAKDWASTPLGAVSAWPQSLRTAVSILLNSRYPMFIFWGPQLIKIYNDGYRPITGHKHPWALGRPDTGVGLEAALAHLTALAEAVDLPVNADFEGAYAEAPEAVAANVTRACATGVAGLSVEDGWFATPEYHDFYSHYGIDPIGIMRAMWVNMRTMSFQQGGSTLTQQLMKNFLLSDERTLARKITEAGMALIAERKYSKDFILENYLNEIYLGQRGSQGIFGVWEAAQFYFSKPLADLTVGESALLAGLIIDGDAGKVIAISGLVAALVAAIVSYPLMRLSDAAAVITSFALLVVLYTVMTHWSALTNGPRTLFGVPKATDVKLAALVALLALVAAIAFKESRTGKLLHTSDTS